jgi:hypothetical protein
VVTADELGCRKPITGMAGCCPRAGNADVTAAPVNRAREERRLIR